MDIKKITICAVLAAILCMLSPFAFYIGAIPISLSTLAIFLISANTKPAYCVTAVAIYILLGVIGLPVFAGFTGGFHKITDLTGGFIIGYLPCALIVSVLTSSVRKKIIYPISMITGTAACYACGTAVYTLVSGSDLRTAITACVLPFLIGDIIKIILACAVSCVTAPRIAPYCK